MSGKGLHLIFELPEQLLYKYPNAVNKLSLQDEQGYYEILLNHMVTFTRNTQIPYTPQPTNVTFEAVFEHLASLAKPSATATSKIIVTDVDENAIPYFDTLMNQLSNLHYAKKLEDFPQDGNKSGFNNSSYEFGMAGFFYKALQSLLKDYPYSDYEYSDDKKERKE